MPFPLPKVRPQNDHRDEKHKDFAEQPTDQDRIEAGIPSRKEAATTRPATEDKLRAAKALVLWLIRRTDVVGSARARLKKLIKANMATMPFDTANRAPNTSGTRMFIRASRQNAEHTPSISMMRVYRRSLRSRRSWSSLKLCSPASASELKIWVTAPAGTVMVKISTE